ncbi:MAG TPA: PPC domain-containing protein [Gemmataceae bacterium]|jgi:hypothetical protein|nr:PPC domain-containing protein [Gemmataceae bacterium]
MRSFLSVLTCIVFALSARSQTSFPMITHTTPVAVQRGTTAEITVEGQMNFQGAYQMLIPGGGIEAEVLPAPKGKDSPGQKPQVKSVKLKVKVAPDAALGVREFRLATSFGISSLGQLVVVDEPVLQESGNNSSLAQANSISVPCVVCGRIKTVEAVSWFKFTAKAGQAITLEVFGARLEDKIHDLQKHLDPLVALLDADGRELALNDDYLFSDSLLSYTIPKDGAYFVQIRDAKYDGDPRWVYALRVTDRPFASHVYPMAGNPGRTMEVEPIGSAKLIQPRITFTTPADKGIHEVQLTTGGRTTNPVAFYVTDLPIFMEQEPNDTPEQANRVTIPVAINGRIGKRRDVDHFVFHANKGQAIRCEVKARRFGTPLCSSLDSFLEVLTPKGQVLAANDDENGKDSGLAFTPPADGDYIVRIRDLNSKGGDSFVYCLEIDYAKPDFTIRCDPGKAMIGPGSSTAWYFQVTRQNGFAGPVDVQIDGLPAGVSASPLTIPASMTQSVVVLTADEKAKVSAAMVRITGRAKEPALVRIATVSEEIYLPGGGRGRFEAQMPAVAVTEPSDILRVDVSPKTISLKPGEEVKLDVTIQRRPDYDKSVSLDVLLRHLGSVYGNPLPPGVTIVEGKSKTLIGTGNKGHIVLKTAPNAAPIENVPVCVLAHVSINFVVKISYASAMIPLTIKK